MNRSDVAAAAATSAAAVFLAVAGAAPPAAAYSCPMSTAVSRLAQADVASGAGG